MITERLSGTITPQSPNPRFNKKEILDDFEIVFKSRLASNQIRKEVLLGRAKFGIGGAGKELLQVALAKSFKKGDYYSGYYRDQTFMLKTRLASVSDLFASLYADVTNDPFSGGRQMNNHFATPFVDEKGQWLDLNNQYNVSSAIAPLAGQVPRALGLALASKKFKEVKQTQSITDNTDAISYCIIGDAATSEGIFFECVNAAGVMQIPIIFVIQDDGYGISVPTKYQTTKGSITAALSGFSTDENGRGLSLYQAKAWDYSGLHKTFAEASAHTRKNGTPAIIHITECTQPNGHSTSGSHERYKDEARLTWEKEMDCLEQFEKWIINNKWFTQEELNNIKIDLNSSYKKEQKEAWNNYKAPILKKQNELLKILEPLKTASNESIENYLKEIKTGLVGSKSDLLKMAKAIYYSIGESDLKSILHHWIQQNDSILNSYYVSDLYSSSSQAAINVAHIHPTYSSDSPMINGSDLLNTYFDHILSKDNRVFAFGEDVGKIGGVNQAFKGLQNKYGESRVFDTGIREWSIVGQAIGMAMRGLRPIAELQYLDYLAYAFPALSDDLATLRYRTKGQQIAPVIVRTRGHRLEGVWHSGSPIGLLLNSMKGIYILTPRNMTQAVGMYNTMLQSDDPAIIIECLNGYRKKEQLPTNLAEYTIALGLPEVMSEGSDITIVTYGVCVELACKAQKILSSMDIHIEVIDIQTIIPFDLEHRIVESIKKTNRVIFMDEDVPGGATAYMMQEVLEKQKAYKFLDAAPITISAKEYRPPYGDDGDYISKPDEHDIIKSSIDMMYEANPSKYGHLVNL